MVTRAESAAPESTERVHLEKCKICGEYFNRLNLDEVVQHLDHSKRPTAAPFEPPGAAKAEKK